MPCDATCPHYQPKPAPVTLEEAMEVVCWVVEAYESLQPHDNLRDVATQLKARYEATKERGNE
jgi:hypothetical protein